MEQMIVNILEIFRMAKRSNSQKLWQCIRHKIDGDFINHIYNISPKGALTCSIIGYNMRFFQNWNTLLTRFR